jgi:glycosyltransferase involved in cell wall biosynthesis
MVVGSYHPEVTGGGVQCRTLVRALRERVRFTVLATTRDPALPAFELVDAVPVHRLHVHLTDPTAKLRALGRLTRLYLSLRDRFEIVHLHGFTRKAIPLLWLARWTGKRTLCKMTSVGADDAITAARRPLARRALRAVDRVISVSPALTERYSKAGLRPERLAVIPNGVDLHRFRPAPAGDRPRLRGALGLPPDAPLVTFVGFFSRDKAPHLLVEAWCWVRREVMPPPTLLLIGATAQTHVEVDPEVVADVRHRIRAEGVEASVRFVEKTHDVPGCLRASDIFVLPSLREGMSNALLEAMASGLPCVAATLPGITDAVIEHRVNGLLFPPGDATALAGALRFLLRDPARAQELGRRARETVEQRYSITRTARRVLEVYESLHREPPAHGRSPEGLT